LLVRQQLAATSNARPIASLQSRLADKDHKVDKVMPIQSPSPASDDSEEARAFLQARVALFWKVLFFFFLFANVLGVLGAVRKPGVDFLITSALTAVAGSCWWLSARGQRSKRFSRRLEAGGLLFTVTGGAFLNRFVLAGFLQEHSLVSKDAVLMADGLVWMLGQGGTALKLAIRAALIPSSPRRTAALTSALGVPILVVSTLLVPTGSFGLAFRSGDSGAHPWLPLLATMMWSFAVVTSTVISWVIYGLRVEVQKARRLGQYVLERKIGEGGMGQVYRAHHGMMRRPTALKLLHGDRVGERQLHRFEREVQLTARLTHPNTITIFDYGRTSDGVFYYAMELLDGANLQRIVGVGGPQSPGRVVRILTMACGALAEAHGIGLIHRDIKPANIALCTQGGESDVVKVLDFGLVKELAVDREVELTAANSLIGTPQYMAPESMLAPESVDARTDVYSLGAVAYFLLAGEDVFTGSSVLEVCAQHLHERPKALSSRGVVVPEKLEALVLACLEKDPARRPQSAAELRRQLEACNVEEWSTQSARNWWLEHQAELDSPAVESGERVKTLAVDAARVA
jgi:serine/threonine-protein kinase